MDKYKILVDIKISDCAMVFKEINNVVNLNNNLPEIYNVKSTSMKALSVILLLKINNYLRCKLHCEVGNIIKFNINYK